MNPTILFLASDPAISRVIGKRLEATGYSVLVASDVAGAAGLLKSLTFDLLMVRHYTENLSGHEAAMYLRRICPGIPVLIVGGLLDDHELEDREVLERFEIFPKLFTSAELLDKVKEVLVKYPPRHDPSGKS